MNENSNSASTGSGINTSGTNASAYSNSLFLSHADNPGAVIVSQVFDGKRFGAWKRAMTLTLLVKNKLGFVTSRTKKPDEDDPGYEDWERCNSIKELNLISQGADYVTTYYTKFKQIWDEFAFVDEMPDCSCTTGEAWLKRMDRQQLVQFLFGLNDSYASTRGSILHRKPTPVLAEAYAILILEKQQ
ncbi:uncharacterized protein LOC112518292 [Cynara cardunculus var. scolymus]|uniref:uncharacterized protein LOC112518292 n=1 Tax=Cynara cardunculus var. scolymus TaxID=59895 RepID=UPI000D62855A|nr:uncharacterized protein LOC112518292 [Cynara cardunculus var. scolymus]